MATQTQAPTTEAKPDPFRGLHPIFRDCAGDDGFRYSLAKPWRDGEFVYATNGAVLVRVLVASLGPDVDLSALEIGDRRVLKDPGGYFAGAYQAEPIDLPDVGPADRRCLFCEGTGQIKEKTCPECDGDKFCTCSCGDDHPCGYCEGLGVIPPHECENCEGSGVGPRPEPRRVVVAENVLLDRHWIAVLREYGAAVYLPLVASSEIVPRDTTPVRFTIGDIEGRVCRMNSKT